MRVILIGLGLLATAAIWFGSATANYYYGYSMGETQSDHQWGGGIMVALDIFKVTMPFVLASAWINRRWLTVATTAMMFSLCVCLSIYSGIQYAQEIRAIKSGKVLAKKEQVVTWRTQQQLVIRQISEIDKQATKIASIQLDAMRKNRRWKSTNGCSNATSKRSINFCKQYQAQAKKHQIAAATRSAQQEKLGKQLRALDAKIAASGSVRAMRDGNPGAAMVADIVGSKAKNVDAGAVLALALMLELGAGMGFYVMLNHGAVEKKSTKIVAVNTPSRQVAPSPAKAEQSGTSRDGAGKGWSWGGKKGAVVPFVGECIEHRKGARLPLTTFYEAYKGWCAGQDMKAVSVRKFVKELEPLAKEYRLKTEDLYEGKVWLDFALKDQRKAKVDLRAVA